MATEWFISRNGSNEGPLSSKQLKQLATSGELSSTDLIWKEGCKDWLTASSVNGLFPTAAPPPLPTPPQAESDIFGSLPDFAEQTPFVASGPKHESRKGVETEVKCLNCGERNTFYAGAFDDIGECFNCGAALPVPNSRSAKYNNKKRDSANFANGCVGCLILSVLGVIAISVLFIFVFESLNPRSKAENAAFQVSKDNAGVMARYYSFDATALPLDGNRHLVRVSRSPKDSAESGFDKLYPNRSIDDYYVVDPDGTVTESTVTDWESLLNGSISGGG